MEKPHCTCRNGQVRGGCPGCVAARAAAATVERDKHVPLADGAYEILEALFKRVREPGVGWDRDLVNAYAEASTTLRAMGEGALARALKHVDDFVSYGPELRRYGLVVRVVAGMALAQRAATSSARCCSSSARCCSSSACSRSCAPRTRRRRSASSRRSSRCRW